MQYAVRDQCCGILKTMREYDANLDPAQRAGK
jgi:hypothetical protein